MLHTLTHQGFSQGLYSLPEAHLVTAATPSDCPQAHFSSLLTSLLGTRNVGAPELTCLAQGARGTFTIT